MDFRCCCKTYQSGGCQRGFSCLCKNRRGLLMCLTDPKTSFLVGHHHVRADQFCCPFIQVERASFWRPWQSVFIINYKSFMNRVNSIVPRTDSHETHLLTFFLSIMRSVYIFTCIFCFLFTNQILLIHNANKPSSKDY